MAPPAGKNHEIYGHHTPGWLPAASTRPCLQHIAPYPVPTTPACDEALSRPRYDLVARPHLCMQDLADPHVIDGRVLRNPFRQGSPTIGTASGHAIVDKHCGQRLRNPYVLPSTPSEMAAAIGHHKDAFDLVPEFDLLQPLPWRAGVRPPPQIRNLIDEDGDGQHSLEESNAALPGRGVLYSAYGQSPMATACSRLASQYKYGQYDIAAGTFSSTDYHRNYAAIREAASAVL